jgi:hypothetical protein
MPVSFRWLVNGLCLALLLLPAACGDLPQPFLGNPGATAERLAVPPTPRLAVPAPSDALLPDAASRRFADDLATALAAQTIPAVNRDPQKTDWRLVTRAEQRGETVVPVFTVLDPRGNDQGKVEGAPIPTRAWAAAGPATLQTSAAEAAPKIASLLNGIQTAIAHADPNSLYNRRARVMVADVTGAPGDGDVSLTKQMRKDLGTLGPVLVPQAESADFVVKGQVKAVPIPGHKERIEIQWVITDAKGAERGRVVQLNEIPAGALDHYWGDVAVVVATEASGGVNDVILRQSGREPNGGQPQEVAQPAADQRKSVRGQNGQPLLEGAGPEHTSSGANRPAPDQPAR